MPRFIKNTNWLQSAFDDTAKIHLENVEMDLQEECSEVLEQNFKKFKRETREWIDCFKISPQHYAQMSIIAPNILGLYESWAFNTSNTTATYAPFVEYGSPQVPQGTIIDSTAHVIDENVKDLPAPSNREQEEKQDE